MLRFYWDTRYTNSLAFLKLLPCRETFYSRFSIFDIPHFPNSPQSLTGTFFDWFDFKMYL